MVQILVRRTHELVHRFEEDQLRLRPTTRVNSATTVQGPATSNTLPVGMGRTRRRIEATTTSPAQRTLRRKQPTSTQNSVSITSPTSSNPQGATRSMMAFLLAAYDEETVNDDLRTVLRFDPESPHTNRCPTSIQKRHNHTTSEPGL